MSKLYHLYKSGDVYIQDEYIGAFRSERRAISVARRELADFHHIEKDKNIIWIERADGSALGLIEVVENVKRKIANKKQGRDS